MQIGQGLGNVIIGRIDHTNFVHGMPHRNGTILIGRAATSQSRETHLLSTTFTPSQTATIRPVAITVITALKV